MVTAQLYPGKDYDKMDNEPSTNAGQILAGKEDRKRDNDFAARRAKLGRRPADEKAGSDTTVRSEDGTTSDDFYSEVLMRFGIQI